MRLAESLAPEVTQQKCILTSTKCAVTSSVRTLLCAGYQQRFGGDMSCAYLGEVHLTGRRQSHKTHFNLLNELLMVKNERKEHGRPNLGSAINVVC